MIVTQTPLRISFAGGGTDFPEFYRQEPGAVLSAAIDKFVYVVVKARFDRRIRVAYSRTETVEDPAEIEHDLVREAVRMAGLAGGFEVCTLADIPAEGSGLGSSASLTVGLLNAFHAFAGRPQSAEVVSRQACQIEIDILGRPIGKQDQYIAAYGGLNVFRFLPNDEVAVNPLSLSESRRRSLEESLLLFFTGRTRRADSILSAQRANIEATRPFLRQMRDLTTELHTCLLNGFGDEFGRLMHRGWQCKRQLAPGISDPYLDQLYDRALAAGATGGKISGAGGGGFLLLHCPPHRRDSVRAALADLTEMPFRLFREGSKILLNTGPR